MRYEYKIIHANDQQRFEWLLNEAGAEGWRLDGGISVHRSTQLTHYCAAMVKEARNYAEGD